MSGHLSDEIVERATPADRPVSAPPLGAHPDLPSGAGAGRLADARSRRRDRRALGRHACRGLRHGVVLRHAPHRAGRRVPGSVCTNIACMLRGAYELLEHAEEHLGIRAGGTTADGIFTLEEAECLADCGRAPCLQVNHRFFGDVTDEDFDRLTDDLVAGRLDDDVPQPRDAGADPAKRWSGASAPRTATAGRSGRLMTVTERRGSSRRGSDFEDSHTLERYLATGGYDGLNKALSMTPEEVAAEVDAASLLGRGGAGFPAGRKWSMLRKAADHLPGHKRRRERAGDLQGPPADRAGSASDHRRRDHRRVRDRRGAGVHLCTRRVRSRHRADAAGPERGLRATARSAGRSSGRTSASTSSCTRVPAPTYAARRRRSSRASRESAGFPRIKPPYFPAAIGLYGEPTVVNNVETMSNLPWIVTNGGAAFAALGAGQLDGHAAVRARRTRGAPGCLRARDGEDDVPGPHLRPEARWRDQRRS